MVSAHGSVTFAPATIPAKPHAGNNDKNSAMNAGSYNADVDVENAEFAAKKWVWVSDEKIAFMKGFITDTQLDGKLKVRCVDGSDRIFNPEEVDQVNPPKFDKTSDMAELTFLNEASVVHNLSTRYTSDLIYTYSGLFLVAINPYKNLPIYNKDTILAYKNKHRDETKPHIFAITDLALRNMVEMNENQSILVTGESGAGKTENTKKVIQYLAAVTNDKFLNQSHSQPEAATTTEAPSFEQQILQANPILEAFGNAQTVRNNNSSRFGKFIRIEFNRGGSITGASIDWFLFEKSRVISQNSDERNYHVFYQILQGASRELKSALLLDGDANAYAYLKNSNKTIKGVSDKDEFKSLQTSFKIMGFSTKEQNDIFRVTSAVLQLGNIEVGSERSDQARLLDSTQADRVCHLLGIPVDKFTKSLLRPKVKAGREWVDQSRNAEQVKFTLDALAKSLYERTFGSIVDRINQTLERSSEGNSFIGVLDIAGFEIFKCNSFEQLCINYTNEKLQQFFNHHMFVLEQEEYTREQIEWKFIDFGHDLQPTINIIEKSNPIGIFSCLDEDCVMPKATDESFTNKLHQIWENKSTKYKPSRFNQGFILTHYAADVEYSTEGWLEKNKDPLNDNIVELLANSTEPDVRKLFKEEAALASTSVTSSFSVGATTRVRKGLFRTVAQRHKEQLSHLMTQLHSTHPHFVRCIVPNNSKQPRLLNNQLVLDQLRCNGVLEGIRIARTGFPNRLTFNDFRQRYQILVKNMPTGYVDGQKACQIILKGLSMDENLYRVGLTKVFFKSGVLASLEEQREDLVRNIIIKFQAVARGSIKRCEFTKAIHKAQAVNIIKSQMELYLKLKNNVWWNLYTQMRPLLSIEDQKHASRIRDAEFKKLEGQIKSSELKVVELEDDHRKIEHELQKYKGILEDERQLALDKEEILKRSQAQEADLKEKLADALEDLDRVEGELELLLEDKERINEQTVVLKDELKTCATVIEKLENERKTLLLKVTELEAQVETATGDYQSQLKSQERLNEEIFDLKETLTERTTKISALEAQLAQTKKELEEKLSGISQDFESSNTKVRDLTRENDEIRKQLDELYVTSSDYETMIGKKEAELTALKAHSLQQQTELEATTEQLFNLKNEHGVRGRELNSVREELQTAKSDLVKLEEDAVETRKLLESKISEGLKQSQGRDLLNSQLDNYKAKIQDLESAMGAAKQKTSSELGDLRQQLERISRERDQLKARAEDFGQKEAELSVALDKAESAKSVAMDGTKRISEELADLKKRFVDTETSYSSALEELKSLKTQLFNVNNSYSSLTDSAKNLESEKVNLTNQVAYLKQSLEEQSSRHRLLISEKASLQQEMDKVSELLSVAKTNLERSETELEQRNAQMVKLSESVESEIKSKVDKLTEAKVASDATAAKLSVDLEALSVEHSATIKQKEKMARQIEDLNHENAREVKAAQANERLVGSLQAQVADFKKTITEERRNRSEAETLRRKVQIALDASEQKLAERNSQLMALQKVVSPASLRESSINNNPEWDTVKDQINESVDLARRLQESERKRKIAEETRSLIEEQFNDARQRWSMENNARSSSTSRNSLVTDFSRSHNSTLHKRPLSTSPIVLENGNVAAAATDKSLEHYKSKYQLSENRVQELERQLRNMSEQRNVSDKENIDFASNGQRQRSASPTKDQDLLRVYHETSKNLILVKETLADRERENRSLRESLEALQESAKLFKATSGSADSELEEMRIQIDVERSKNMDLGSSLKLYKGRAEEYYSKLEAAEIAVMKASRSESFKKSQLNEVEQRLANALEDRKDAESQVSKLRSAVQTLEHKLEDRTIEYDHLLASQTRMAKELEAYKYQRSKEVTATEKSIESTVVKYHQEIDSLSKLLGMANNSLLSVKDENRRLQQELEQTRSETASNPRAWNTEKAKLEIMIRDLHKSNEESMLAQQDAQKRVGSLLSQTRTLRNNMEALTADRDQILKDRQSLEQRFNEMSERFDELASRPPADLLASSRGRDKEVDSLRSALESKQYELIDVLNQLKKKKDTPDGDWRQRYERLEHDKAGYERQCKELQKKIIDMETKQVASSGNHYMNGRLQELEQQLAKQREEQAESLRWSRGAKRTIRELEQHLEHKDKHVRKMAEEVEKGESRIARLVQTVESIQSSESQHQLKMRRAEREAKEMRERALIFEKELEEWKDRYENLLNRSSRSSLV